MAVCFYGQVFSAVKTNECSAHSFEAHCLMWRRIKSVSLIISYFVVPLQVPVVWRLLMWVHQKLKSLRFQEVDSVKGIFYRAVQVCENTNSKNELSKLLLKP